MEEITVCVCVAMCTEVYLFLFVQVCVGLVCALVWTIQNMENTYIYFIFLFYFFFRFPVCYANLTSTLDV